MTQADASTGNEFLTVAEAADRTGQSRLRVREAAARGLIRSRRDNEGRLRVDLPGAELPRDAQGTLDPDAIIGFLFDELEDVQAGAAEAAARADRLADLVARQGMALDQAAEALDTSDAAQTRLAEMLDRAFDLLEQSQSDGAEGPLSEMLDRAFVVMDASAAENARLAQVSERALGHLDALGDGLENSLAQNARYDALLARAVALAEANGADTLAPATDRAFGLLEDALARAEAEHHLSDRTGRLLDRALQAGEQMQGRLGEQDRRIAAQDQTLDSALSMSERAVAVAAAAKSTPPRKRGFLGWLFGT